MHRALSLGLVFALGCAVSCSSQSDDIAPPPAITPHVFVGHVTGTNALVAIVESNETVVAYTCGIGDKLATHTGWYFGVKQNEAVENVQLVNGPSGLRMRGTLNAAGGTGVLTLADASEVTFSVEPARGKAGLYDYEDAGVLVGFIRANDGETAGNSVSRIDGAGEATALNTTTSTAVTEVVGGTSTRTAALHAQDFGVALPPPPAPAPAQPDVTLAIDSSRLVVGTTITVADNRVITRSGPVVVFMMHGMADNLGAAPAGAADDPKECAGVKDTPFYGRCEWGQDFLPGLFGATGAVQLTALDGTDLSGDRFITAVQDDRTFPDENLGHTVDAAGCVTDPLTTDKPDPRFARHFVTPGALKATSRFDTASKLGLPPAPPRIAAFTTWRDPTRGLVFSGRRVTRQIYAALRWYEDTYKIKPGVILLAQSFGGLASRFMLSKPDPALLNGNATLNREGVKLCKEDLAKMDFVRDRTLYLLTLATPHEGSYLAEWGVPVKQALSNLLAELRSGVATSLLAKVLQGMATVSSFVNLNLRPTLTDSLVSSIDGFLPQLESAGALVEMQLARMQQHNLNTISPERARRTAASPIVGASKTLIPIYVTLSRSPGSDAFDGPDIIKGLKKFEKKRPKVRGWINQTMFVSDVLTRQLLPNGFGSVNVAPYTEHRAILDRRERLFDAALTPSALTTKYATDIRNVLRLVSPWFLGKFGSTGDAVITAMQGDSNAALPHMMIPIHTDQKWKIGFDGTTIDVPVPAFQCGTAQIVLDYDALARLLVKAYGNTPNIFAAIANKDLKAVLEALGVLIQSSDQFAQGVATWFMDHVKAGFASPLPAECNLTPDNVFDIFAITELANWKIVETKGSIPVPVFIGTGQAVSDGEMDTDGAVHSASALGFTLGRVPFYFEHNRTDDAGKGGSWYRLYDNPVTERHNHGQQYENEVGLWIRQAFLSAQVGPVPATDTFSVWPQ